MGSTSTIGRLAALLALGALGALGAVGGGCASGETLPDAEITPVVSKKKADAGASAVQPGSSDDSSDDAGAAGGDPDGGSGPGADAGAEKIRVTAVKLDGKDMTLTASEAHVNPYGAFVTLDFHGEGAPDKTEIILSFQKAGTGCVPYKQDLFLYPGGSTSDAYQSGTDAKCGLTIDVYPDKNGDMTSGSFNGKVTGLNGAAGKTKTLEFTFNLKRVDQN